MAKYFSCSSWSVLGAIKSRVNDILTCLFKKKKKNLNIGLNTSNNSILEYMLISFNPTIAFKMCATYKGTEVHVCILVSL